MKKLFTLLFVFALGVGFFSCDDEDDDTTGGNEDINVSGVITENTTWGPDQIVFIEGRVIVDAGVTLTIEEGTIVKGLRGEGLNASVLMVARGGMIDAQGTASKPIIMTTELDDVEVGQLSGTYGSKNDKGKWGGLVVLGSAPISVDGATEAQIEGVPANEPLGLYGGSDVNDNSGTISYVSIRYGGAVIDAAAGSEINGLTLGGVGAGTTIDHVEVYGNVDDGVEFFGGSVSVSDVLVAFQGDDALDVDQAYSGTVSNFVLVQDENSDEGLEIDGPEGSENADGKFTIQDGTIKSADGAGSAADFKSKAQGSVSNVLWMGYSTATVKLRASYTDECTTSKTDALTNAVDGELTFTNAQFDGVSVYTKSVVSDTDDTDCEVTTEDADAAEAAVVPGTATGASNASAWDAWTIASIREEI